MRTHCLFVAFALSLVPAVASADGHRAGGFGGGGFQKSHYTGMFHFGFDYVVPKGALDRIPLAVELSIAKGNTDTNANAFKTYAFGTSVPIPVGKTDHAFAVRALIGGTFDKQLTSVVGVSYEWVKDRQMPGHQFGATVKLDGIFIDEAPKHMRLSVGLVYRFREN
jgi:hypothetical protein